MAKGYKAPRMPGGQGGMMQQLQKLQEQIQETQAQLAEETTSGTAGGGAVKITVTGDQRCRSVEIDAEIIKDIAASGDVEGLADMIMVAFNNALDASRKMAEDRLGPLAGGLPF